MLQQQQFQSSAQVLLQQQPEQCSSNSVGSTKGQTTIKRVATVVSMKQTTIKRVATVVSMKQEEELSQQNGGSSPESISQCQGARLPMYIYADHAPSKVQRAPSCNPWEMGGTEAEDTSSPLCPGVDDVR